MNNSDILDLASGGQYDYDKSIIMKTDSKNRETLIDTVSRTKREMSSLVLTIEYRESLRKLRVEKLDYQREFLKLATDLNKLINSEIADGEALEDMHVEYL